MEIIIIIIMILMIIVIMIMMINDNYNTRTPYKVCPILDHFHQWTEDLIYPDKQICIDESMSPWRSRISFRQYILKKRLK